ncbi:MAG: glycoside hydrolase family 35 protein [Clostridium sp.]
MNSFKIEQEFLLNNKKIKIISGAIHYFRIIKEDWYHSLYNLKAMGGNTVESYIPWNIHEQNEGEYDFSENLDVVEFIKLAQRVGLYVIVRPTPYICAEWEFGGLPGWLLNYKDIKLRSSDPNFMEKVRAYYEKLIPMLVPYEINNGGPILMMQVENEYGSFGNDKEYLSGIRKLMIDNGVRVPLVTSDGPWEAALESGTLIEDDVFVTGNFGSKSKENFETLKNFHREYNKKWPLMCMEFWGGWFNRCGESIVKREARDLAECAEELLKYGSINFYMFHGGTNFGFMNGCSARGRNDLPQITSYDYDAILDEQGNPRDKFYLLREVISRICPNIEVREPIIKPSMIQGEIKLSKKVSLFSVVDEICENKISKYPMTMEELGNQYGYTMYSTVANYSKKNEKLRVIDASDRIHVYTDEKYIVTQYKDEIGEDIFIDIVKNKTTINILVENLGRVNYGHKLLADTQRKGIRTGVMLDLHFHTGWKQSSIKFDRLDKIDFSKEWKANTPAFYLYEFDCKCVEDTFLDTRMFGKGCVIVNGFNIGRFWEKGPYLSLYIPKHLLKEVGNKIIIFETEGKYSEEIGLKDTHIFKEF